MDDPDDSDDNFTPSKKSAYLSYLAEGEWLLLKKEYQNAVKSFSAAVALNPSDKRGFVARCKCYLQMGELDNAIKDADTSLKHDKKFHEGLFLKAEALFHKGEYEFALMYYERGHKIRANFEGFRLGIQKAEEAIENTTYWPFSVSVGDKEDKARKEAAHHVDVKTTQTKRTLKSEKILDQVQGELYNQRKFLQNLMNDEELAKSKTKRGEQLQDIIQNSLKSLDICADAWITEKSPSLKKTSKQKNKAPCEPSEYLQESFNEIDASLNSGNAKDSLKKAEEVMHVVQTYTEKVVPNKKEVIGTVHSCMGCALFELGDYGRALEHHLIDLDLAQDCDLSESISRALENLGRTCAKMGEFEKAIKFWKKKIVFVQCDLEKTWLLHEIGCCYLELDCYEEARDCGILAIEAAEEIADEKWMIKTNVLVAQSELSLENFQSSASYFEEALIHARIEEDDFAIDAIQTVLEDVKLKIEF